MTRLFVARRVLTFAHEWRAHTSRAYAFELMSLGLAQRLHSTSDVAADERKKRVLIVDDDPPIRALLKRVGFRAGLETETAKDGQEAYEKLAEAEYDIVIVDLMMPRVSGFELIEKIAELDPRPTVIVSTAMMNGDLARLDDSMIRRVIRKPFDVDAMTTALTETVKEIIDRRPLQITSGDAVSHANAAAEHANAAAQYAAAAADHATAAAEEAAKAAEASQTSIPPAKQNATSADSANEQKKPGH